MQCFAADQPFFYALGLKILPNYLIAWMAIAKLNFDSLLFAVAKDRK